MRIENIPEELRKTNNWSVWISVPSPDPTVKPRKIPIDLNTGKWGDSTNPDKFGFFDQALELLSTGSYAGLAFRLEPPYIGIDLDDCINEEFETQPRSVWSDFSSHILSKFHTYCEKSISGTGIKMICKGDVKRSFANKKNKNEKIEVYNGGRFFAVTGDIIFGFPSDVNECQKELDWLCKNYMPKEEPIKEFKKLNVCASNSEKVKKAIKYIENRSPSISGDGGHNKCLAVAIILREGFDIQDFDLFVEAIQDWNNKCQPPWSEAELLHKFKSAEEKMGKQNPVGYLLKLFNEVNESDYKKVEEIYKEKVVEVPVETEMVSMPTKFKITEDDLANIIVKMHAHHLRYCSALGGWLSWDDKKYSSTWGRSFAVKCITDLLNSAIKLCYTMPDETKELKEAKIDRIKKLTSMQTNAKIKGILSLMAEKKGLISEPKDFDSDPHFFNCFNGVVNLKDGNLIPHDSSLKITYISEKVKYDVTADCPLWKKCMDKWFAEDKELIDYVQRLAGLNLSGTYEKLVMFCYGHGNNGKSVFMRTLKTIVGEYSKHVPIETLCHKNMNGGGASPDIAKLKGARFVTSTETEEGKRINESLIKELTGNEVISARHLYGNPMEFLPEFKVWLSGNHKPTIKGTDSGIWSRIKEIPFEVEIPEAEKDLKIWDKLELESSGILNWLIQGYRKYLESGLTEPEKVKKAVAEYKAEMDTLGAFIEDHVKTEQGYNTTFADMFVQYMNWCEANGEKFSYTKKKLGMMLRERGFEEGRTSTYKYWKNTRVYAN